MKIIFLVCFVIGLATNSANASHALEQEGNSKEHQKAKAVESINATPKSVIFETPSIPCYDLHEASLSRNGKLLVVASQGRITRYDAQTGKKLGETKIVRHVTGLDIRVIPNLNVYSTEEGVEPNHKRIYDASSGKLLMTTDPTQKNEKGAVVLDEDEKIVNESAFHPSIITSKNGILYERHFPGGSKTKIQVPVPKDIEEVSEAFFNRDKSRLIVASLQFGLGAILARTQWIVINTKTGKELSRTLINIDDSPSTTFMSPDLQTLSSAKGKDNSILFEAPGISYELKDLPAPVTALAGQNSFGGLLLSAMKNHSVRLWDLRLGKAVFDLKLALHDGETVSSISGLSSEFESGRRVLFRIENKTDPDLLKHTCRVSLVDVTHNLPNTSKTSFQDLWKSLSESPSPQTFSTELSLSSQPGHLQNLTNQISKSAEQLSKTRLSADQKKALDVHLKKLDSSSLKERTAAQKNLVTYLDSLGFNESAVAIQYLQKTNSPLEVKRRLEALLNNSHNYRDLVLYQARGEERLQLIRGIRALCSSVITQPSSEDRTRAIQLMERLASGNPWLIETRLAQELLIMIPVPETR